ncbi:MAG: aspartate--tRNA ligase [Planctomycetes bacterium]|nr:aspartate--tRNA ligase [Planctomycetota bacterium]
METTETASWKRTHTCGELTVGNDGQAVTLCGWVANRRDHGGIFFIDLRDRYGITQVTVDPGFEGTSPELLTTAGNLKAEDVVSVTGTVKNRDAAQINPNRDTGAIEVFARKIEVLAGADTPPFEILDKSDTSVELRMKYRYLDMRRAPVREALELRSRFILALRNSLVRQEFIEVETPILTKATPEGARDYLVPSRVHPDSFYALPQSPQIFKQLCMVAGLDRYFQIARCFRDEDLRADRQPEFTQLDLEMSFVEEDDVVAVMEQAVAAAFKECLNVEVSLPFPRIDYREAMERYGLDKPDLRFGIELIDVAEQAKDSGFKVFTGALEAGGRVKALCVPGAAEWSRKKIDGLADVAQEYGGKGLAWAKVGDGELTGSVAKFFPGEAATALCEQCGAEAGDLLLFAADREAVVHRVLGELRNHVARELGLVDPNVFRFAWVMHFPLFEWSDERQRFEPSHHPFTAPLDWDVDFNEDTGSIQSRAYDMVLNGWELGSGSVRIHRRDVQERLFAYLGLGEEEVQEKFGFLLEAFRYGAPPHAGFAVGLDRLVTLALGKESIRDVIAFPKTTSATCLLTGAPSAVQPEQLAELRIRRT